MDIERIAVFIDGFNVYYGLRQKKFDRFYWLDYRALAETFVKPHQTLVAVSYFTTRVRSPDQDVRDQSVYLDALSARGGIEIVEGKLERRPMSCPDCNHRWKRPQEKMTDVALASGLIVGALRDMYDTALLVCADADLIPAVRVARSEGKRLLVVSPRGRTSDALAKEGDGHLHISTSALGRCQLADPIITATGITLRRPTTWR